MIRFLLALLLALPPASSLAATAGSAKATPARKARSAKATKPAAPDAAAPVAAPAAEPAPAPAAPAPAAEPAPRPKPWSLAVLDLSQRGVDAELGALVSEMVQTEANKLDGPRVIGTAQVREMLQHDRQRALLGAECSESGCLAELAGALGTDKLLSGSINQVGEGWMLVLRLINTRTTRVETQASEHVAGGGEALLEAIGRAFEKLFPEVPLKAGEVRGVPPALRARAASIRPAADRRFAWACAGAALAFAGAGGGFGLAARSAEQDWEALTQKSLSEPVSASEVASAADSAKSRALVANVLYGVAGAAAITSVILFAFGGDSEPEPVAGKVAFDLQPLAGGALATVGGSF